MKRTFAIGDIHGADKALEQLIQRIDPGPEDRLIFLGDYVDGLPDTPAVIDRLIRLKHKHDCVFIRGNHDQWAIDWFRSCRDARDYRWRPQDIHYMQGGRSTYDAYMNIGDPDRVATMNEHDQFLQATKPHFIDEQNRVFVHGGFNKSLDDPWMIQMWDRDLMEDAHDVQASAEMPERFLQYKEIYVGHTATNYFTGKEEVANWLNLWALDTNCGWGGPLSAINVDTKEVIQSDRAQTFYPDYTGR